MRSPSLILAASMAAVSVYGPRLVLADAAPAPSPAPERVPRYYFPRNVKRFTNTTTVVAPTPEPQDLRVRQDFRVPGILDEPFGRPDGPGSNTTTTTTVEVTVTPVPTPTGDGSSDVETPTSTRGLLDLSSVVEEIVPPPTEISSLETSAADISDDAPPPTTTRDALDILPSISVVPSVIEDLSSALSSIVDPIATPIVSEVSSLVDDAVSSVVPSAVSDIEEVVSSVVPSAVSEIEEVVSSVVPSAVSEVEEVVTSAAPSAISEIVPTETGITVGLSLPSEVASIVTSVVGDVSSIASDVISEVTSVVSDIIPSVTEPPLPTGVNPSAAVSDILDDVSSIVSEALSDAQNLNPSVIDSIVSSVQSEIAEVIPTPVTSLVGDISSIVASVGSSLAGDLSSKLDDVTTPLPTELPTQLPTEDLPSIPISTGGAGPSVISSLLSQASSLLTAGPPLQTSTLDTPNVPTDVVNITSTPSVPSPSDAVSSVINETDPTTAPEETLVLPSIPSTPIEIPPTTTRPPISIQPTATNNLTAYPIPSSIIQQPDPTTSLPLPSISGISSDIPKLIQPPEGLPEIPQNSTLVQIGFQQNLNYGFVVENQDSPNQIFKYLHIGVRDGLGISGDDVIMQSLRPFDTALSLGFITTLALLYVPSDMTDKLSNDLNIPVSALYTNEDDSTRTLMNMINPAIPLIAGQLPDGTTPTNPGVISPTYTGRPGGGGDPLDSGNGKPNPPVKGSTVAIAVAAISGSFAYAAAMFFVARRYRRRKSMHLRSSSMSSNNRYSSPMNPAWMSGAREFSGGRDSRGSGSSNSRSVRTAQISAPVMAENSLGWN